MVTIHFHLTKKKSFIILWDVPNTDFLLQEMKLSAEMLHNGDGGITKQFTISSRNTIPPPHSLPTPFFSMSF
jgi:hypothetical protein